MPCVYLPGPAPAVTVANRNRPPQSEVARKLSPLSPIALVYPSLPNFHPFWVFPGPNVLLIRTHPNPFPSVRNRYCRPLLGVTDQILLIKKHRWLSCTVYDNLCPNYFNQTILRLFENNYTPVNQNNSISFI
jgi:hypothetical protein